MEAIYHHRHAGTTVVELNPGLFPPETGPLHVDGKWFRHEDGSLAQIRDTSMFLLFLRYCRGEDITPDLRWMRAFGFNSARVFGPLPWIETPDYRMADFDFVKFDAFCVVMQEWGLFINFSLGHMPGDYTTFHGAINEIARVRWALNFLEHVNEPHVGKKPRPIEDFLPYAQSPRPSAYGYYAELLDDDADEFPRVAHFGTVHTKRDTAWYRRFRSAQEGQDEQDIPWWCNEPAKMTEPGFVYPGGKNNPDTTPREVAWYTGGCHLWCSASTFHSEEGKWGRAPQPGMLQYEDAESVRDNVFLRIDPTWQTGAYNNSENHDSPVDDVTHHGRDIWTYTSLHEHRALSIRFGPVPLKAINGWRIVDAWGPKHAPETFAILER